MLTVNFSGSVETRLSFSDDAIALNAAISAGKVTGSSTLSSSHATLFSA